MSKAFLFWANIILATIDFSLAVLTATPGYFILGVVSLATAWIVYEAMPDEEE